MSIKFDLDLKGYLDDPSKLEGARGEFAGYVMGDFLEGGACGHMVPRREGGLQDDVSREGDQIVWDKDYACYVWEHNVSGKPHWFEVGAEQNGEEWRGYAAQAIREGNV